MTDGPSNIVTTLKRDPLARLLSALCINLVLYSSSEAISVLAHHEKPLWDWINDLTASMEKRTFNGFPVSKSPPHTTEHATSATGVQ